MPKTAPLTNATLCQIGFVARDAAKAARKFSSLTGIPAGEPIFTDGYEKARTAFRGKPSPARAKLIFFHLGPVDIEFIEPIGSPSTWSEFLEKHGDGVHHIAFRVKSAKETSEALDAQGIPPVQSGVFEGGSYAYSDAEKDLGVIFELLDSTNS